MYVLIRRTLSASSPLRFLWREGLGDFLLVLVMGSVAAGF